MGGLGRARPGPPSLTATDGEGTKKKKRQCDAFGSSAKPNIRPIEFARNPVEQVL